MSSRRHRFEHRRSAPSRGSSQKLFVTRDQHQNACFDFEIPRSRQPRFFSPGNDAWVLENPCLIVEVTSESTAETDHDKKLEAYTRLPSMQPSLLVSQTERRVIAYKRDNGVWTLEILKESGVVDLPCFESELRLEQIYAGLEAVFAA